MEEDPGKTYQAEPVRDLEKMEETYKRDQEKKEEEQREVGKDYKTCKKRVSQGDVRRTE